MKTLTIVIIILITLVSGLLILRNEIHSPCEKMLAISKDEKVMIKLFEKLTFYLIEPTLLSNYEIINKYPSLLARFFSDIDYALGIDWNALGIEPNSATFRYHSITGYKLDYNNLESSKVSAITIGNGARTRLTFEIKGDASFDVSSAAPASLTYDIKVECNM